MNIGALAALGFNNITHLLNPGSNWQIPATVGGYSGIYRCNLLNGNQVAIKLARHGGDFGLRREMSMKVTTMWMSDEVYRVKC